MADQRILVVDDEPRILRFVQTSLRLAGYDVVTATTGAEALQLTREFHPDVVVLDIVMTPMDGYTVLDTLRTFSQVPVIVFTASAFAAGKAFEHGAQDVLTKPFRPDELLIKIRRLIQSARPKAANSY